MATNPVGWFEIYVNDMTRARSFYETVLALKLDHLRSGDIEMWSFPMNTETPGATGTLAHHADMPAGNNSTLVYFSCSDCAIEAGRVNDAGGELLREKMSIGEHGFVALAKDSEGNMIGLHSMQ